MTYTQNASGSYLTHVIDTNTGKKLRSFYFPYLRQKIRNGYAYKLTAKDEGFYVVEKYRIDPAVYSKR